MEEAEAEVGGHMAGGKPDRWSLDQQSALVVVGGCGSGMVAASEVLWDTGLAVCTDFGGSTRRCYGSAGNRNARLDTGKNPLLTSKHGQLPSREALLEMARWRWRTDGEERASIPCARGSTESRLK